MRLPRRPTALPLGAALAATALGVLAAVVLAAAAVTVAGRGAARDGTTPVHRAEARPAVPSTAPTGAPAAAPLAGRAPTRAFAVGSRVLELSNGPDRPLETTVYYPAAGRAGGVPRAGAAVAEGRFPVVVFSHGLAGAPAVYQALLSRWAAAGIVVVAPAYPHTSLGVAKFDALDVVNQPRDASYTLTAVLALDGAAGDPLRGRLDTAHVAAAGHSGGGITTVGLFTGHRDARLSAGIVLAGNALGVGSVYSGPPASLLFVHGDADPITPYGWARDAYDKAPWAKAFLTLPGQGHGDPYLRSGSAAFTAVAVATTDFLRWTLYGDAAAKARLAGGTGTVRWDNRLG